MMAAGAVGCKPMLGRPSVTVLPIIGAPTAVRNRDDEDSGWLNSIDHTEREAPKQVATCAVVERWPRVRLVVDGGLGLVELGAESSRRTRASLGVPPRRRFGFDDGFVEVFKVASHGAPLRGSAAELRTTPRASRSNCLESMKQAHHRRV